MKYLFNCILDVEDIVFKMADLATWHQNFVVPQPPADAISLDLIANVQDPDFSCILVN